MNTLTNCARIAVAMCLAGILPVVCFLFAGCSRDTSPGGLSTASEGLGSNSVARVGETVITRRALEEELARRGALRRTQAVLEEMINTAVLLNRARAAGYERDPRVVARVNQLIVSTFQEDQLAKQKTTVSVITSDEIESFYQMNAGRFTLAEAARAGIIFLKCSPRATPEKRTESRQNAEQLLAMARHLPGPEFARFVERYSEDQSSRYAAGDNGWLYRGGSSRWPDILVAAAFEIEKAGDLAPLIETEGGFYIVRLHERKPATVRPLAEVRETIEYHVAQRKKHLYQLEFMEAMKRGIRIEINEPLLDSIPSPVRAGREPPTFPRS